MEKSIKDSRSILRTIEEEFHLPDQDIRTFSPLVLAYMGDCIFDLIIRTVLIKEGNRQTSKIHKAATDLVKASAQAALGDVLLEVFTEEEVTIYKRGKNSNPHSIPKNAEIMDYKKATGLEAVMGYLYLQNRMERAVHLVRTGYHILNKEI